MLGEKRNRWFLWPGVVHVSPGRGGCEFGKEGEERTLIPSSNTPVRPSRFHGSTGLQDFLNVPFVFPSIRALGGDFTVPGWVDSSS